MSFYYDYSCKFEVLPIGESIFTEGETMDELKENIREAVRCHFEDSETPSIIRLHYVKEEMMAYEATAKYCGR